MTSGQGRLSAEVDLMSEVPSSCLCRAHEQWSQCKPSDLDYEPQVQPLLRGQPLCPLHGAGL